MDELIGLGLTFIAIETGRLMVWLVSLGRWRGERRGGNESQIHGPAGALSFVRDGQRVVTNIGLSFAGIAFYAVMLVLLVGLLIAATALRHQATLVTRNVPELQLLNWHST